VLLLAALAAAAVLVVVLVQVLLAQPGKVMQAAHGLVAVVTEETHTVLVVVERVLWAALMEI
jgi:hypothetical protein